MDLGEYVTVLRKSWIVIALLVLLGGGVGYAQAAASAPVYRSSSSVYVSLARGNTVSELVQGATYTQNLVLSFVQLATMPVVLDSVINELDLTTTTSDLSSSIQVQSPLNTMIIEIAVDNPDAQQAADIANSVARNLAKTVGSLSPTSANGAASLEMTIVAQAQPSMTPFSPRPRFSGAAGAAVGLALGVLIAIARTQLDNRIRTAKDLPSSPSRVSLGQIPFDPALRRRALSLLDAPHSLLAESYRRLRTNLQFLDASRPLRSLVVTSSVVGEGKSTTTVNLALIMAEKGARVLLVDADLRSPSIARICGIEPEVGLSTVLIREAKLDEVAQPWGAPGLDVIVAGRIPPNPSQLIDSPAMDDFLKSATERYDLVILDTAPLLALTDAVVLSRRTDGALVVARSRKIRRPVLVDALASLDAAGAVCLGVLVNGVPATRSQLRFKYGEKHAAAGPARRDWTTHHKAETDSFESRPQEERDDAESASTPAG